MFNDSGAETRRTVLRSIGGALGVASLAGSASAVTTDGVSSGQCVYADGSNGAALVFSECGGTEEDLVGKVQNYEKGRVDKVCQTLDGTVWAYVIWNDASPSGWVVEEQLTACVTT
ncbi:hypothetical protein [Halorussus pelagicus]|uniref:hypothetical protein n=1 Tax=Halorussus pelagicus TaxID=2505977 RepID=UPI000FFBAD06|nr:hypothetical protein [Halorussus pelagicus]